MQQLLGDKLGMSADANSFFHLFPQRLPTNVRIVLASDDSTMDLDRLADMADKVMEVAAPTVAAISEHHTTLNHTCSSEINQLKEEVASLASLVASLTTRSRHRSSSNKSCRTPSPSSNDPQQDSLCWYFAKFGEAAQKCKSPCSWENSQAGH